jgi:hypothetical protein
MSTNPETTAEERAAGRAARMPDERSAIHAMVEAFMRLKELGWNDAIYCPKDGSSFNVIEPGSTGIFRAHYEGEWPKGSWSLEDGGDLWPSRPILFRLYPDDAATVRSETKRRKRSPARAYLSTWAVPVSKGEITPVKTNRNHTIPSNPCTAQIVPPCLPDSGRPTPVGQKPPRRNQPDNPGAAELADTTPDARGQANDPLSPPARSAPPADTPRTPG